MTGSGLAGLGFGGSGFGGSGLGGGGGGFALGRSSSMMTGGFSISSCECFSSPIDTIAISAICSTTAKAAEILECRGNIMAAVVIAGVSVSVLTQAEHILHIKQSTGLVSQEARSAQTAMRIGDAAG